MKKLLPLLLGAMALHAACVTINVYFPSAEAAQAADRIIDEVRGTRDEAKGETSRQGRQQMGPAARMLAGLLEILVAPAHAQSVDFNASSPAINALQDSLKQRFQELKPYYISGAIGVTNQATVAIRDRNLIPLPERSKVLQLVARQNEDWNALYREIAKANGNPAWEDEIRRTFAERNVAKLDSGWWYQDGSGNWVQK